MQEKVTLFVRRGFFRCFRRLGIPAERYCEVLCGIVRYCAAGMPHLLFVAGTIWAN